MSAVISESYASREFTLGQRAAREIVYDVVGTDDETEVKTLALATAPPVYGGLELDEIQCVPVEVDEHFHQGFWKVHAKYVREDGADEYTFDTSGGTAKITQSLGTVASYGTGPFPPPDFQAAIGVTEDSVEGVDITVPQYSWNETHRFANGSITPTYKDDLFTLTGRTNAAAFKGFDVGEVLFQGVSGSKRGLSDKWELVFRFAASPNATGMTVGPITGISKGGWQYLWVRYADFEDLSGLSLVKRPVACYVERVYEEGDFSLLNIGT